LTLLSRSERWIDNNPLAVCQSSHCAPQGIHSVPRTGLPVVDFTWGDALKRSIVLHSDKRNLERLRVIYHPLVEAANAGREKGFEYPCNPDRTINYYHLATRINEVKKIKTLQGNLKVIDQQRWDDVPIREVWHGTGKKLSMLADFFETLHLMTITPPTLGRNVGWLPLDRGYHRHLIQPTRLQISQSGEQHMDITEMRTQLETGRGAYLDYTVIFEFHLVRPSPMVASVMTAEGA